MPDVIKFNIDNTDINIKDATARASATNALSVAQQANQKAQEALDLASIEITYNSQTETITITKEVTP